MNNPNHCSCNKSLVNAQQQNYILNEGQGFYVAVLVGQKLREPLTPTTCRTQTQTPTWEFPIMEAIPLPQEMGHRTLAFRYATLNEKE